MSLIIFQCGVWETIYTEERWALPSHGISSGLCSSSIDSIKIFSGTWTFFHEVLASLV